MLFVVVVNAVVVFSFFLFSSLFWFSFINHLNDVRIGLDYDIVFAASAFSFLFSSGDQERFYSSANNTMAHIQNDKELDSHSFVPDSVCTSFHITARVIEYTNVSGFTIIYQVKFDLLQII